MLSTWSPRALAALRIMAGLLFLEHGLIKLIGFPGPGPETLPPMILIAGLIETFGGLLLVLGLFTRPAAFLSSGLMAAAYFIGHAGEGFWPSANRGEAAILYCFVFLYIFVAGPGAWALDNRRTGTDRLPVQA
ncbi:DoxX family protein [Paracoccus chinensis]|uniref:Putative oxidoreductase n=1 Tax=Paracoccus chinensis TaxID=525640 RepID=A0A1G9HSW9_9RHOB|nr:DoxX family protein [Paracoccus chinensis]SDL16029.1 putative oxidoreductase [Paracoccus chinensis]